MSEVTHRSDHDAPLRKVAERHTQHGYERIEVQARPGQTAESLQADIDRSFAFTEEMAADGTKEWVSRFRWWGPFKFMAYKEVGPPPWPWPRVKVEGWRTRRQANPTVRLMAGWRSTAYAVLAMWVGFHSSSYPASEGDE